MTKKWDTKDALWLLRTAAGLSLEAAMATSRSGDDSRAVRALTDQSAMFAAHAYHVARGKKVNKQIMVAADSIYHSYCIAEDM